MNVVDRFTAKVEAGSVPVHRPELGHCWLWTADIDPNGYGRFRADGQHLAHRWSYEQFVGPIPDCLELDHLCHPHTCLEGSACTHRRCVNPAHLEPVTHRENGRRGNAGATAGARQQAKTHCPAGHPYDEANTYVTPSNSRRCQTCHRDRERRRYHADRQPPALDFVVRQGGLTWYEATRDAALERAARLVATFGVAHGVPTVYARTPIAVAATQPVDRRRPATASKALAA